MLGDVRTFWLKMIKLEENLSNIPAWVFIYSSPEFSKLESSGTIKKRTPVSSGLRISERVIIYFPFICLTNMFSLGIRETPDFLLHTSLGLLLKAVLLVKYISWLTHAMF